MSEKYSVTIVRTSRQLTPKQRIALKTGMGAISLDQATSVEEVKIIPDWFAELAIHNEHSEDKDYSTFIIVDKDGTAYATGSASFIESFEAIYDEMETANADSSEPEEYAIVAFRQESKNYKGKSFITCRVE